MATLPKGTELAVVGPKVMDVDQAQRFFMGEARGFGKDRVPDIRNSDAVNLTRYWRKMLDELEAFGVRERLPPGSPPVIGDAERELRGRLFALNTLASGSPAAQKFPRPKDVFDTSRKVALSIARFAKIKPIPWRSPVIDAPIRRRRRSGAGLGLALAFAAGYYVKGK